MTTNPPFDLDGRDWDELPDLPSDEEPSKGCPCPWGSGPYPDDGEADPALVKQFDKWDLMQCQTCGGLYWQHRAKADYGDPRMDIHT